MAINFQVPSGQLRLLIADTDDSNPVFIDAEIAGYLNLWGIDSETLDAPRATVKRAAADALDAIATSEALISKVIRTQDVSTDGAKVAASLREHARALRTQADAEDDQSGDGFDVVEFSPYPASF